MKKTKTMKAICLGLVALALVVTLNIGNALAYFTDFIAADGSKTLELGFAETDFHEEIDPANGTKTIWIKNVGDYPGYVRMKAFAGNGIQLTYEPVDALKPQALENYNVKDGSWGAVQEDGYCYYSEYLEPGECTKPIIVKFNIPTDVDSYNVIVVQETTPVLYEENGDPYPDWDATMMNGPDDTVNGPTSELK